MNILDKWEAEANNMISICDNAQINRHPDFVKSMEKIKSMARMNIALIEIVRKKDEAMMWIQPKIHQAHHIDFIDDCQKATCIEFRNALVLTEKLE